MVGRRKLVLVLSMLILLPTEVGEAAASMKAPRTYEVREIMASWVLPKRIEGRYRMYRFEAARYEDADTHEVSTFALAEWLNCEGDEQGLSCGGGPEDFRYLRGKPTSFEFPDDMSAARASFRPSPSRARVTEQWVEMAAVDAASRPFEFLPGTYSRSEGCDGGSGQGEGIFRSMDATGRVFFKKMQPDPDRPFNGIARYTLTTECDPADWWRLVSAAANVHIAQ